MGGLLGARKRGGGVDTIVLGLKNQVSLTRTQKTHAAQKPINIVSNATARPDHENGGGNTVGGQNA